MCERPGKVLYTGLPDRLFGVSGTWDVRRCVGVCSVAWLDPPIDPQAIWRAYTTYYTTADISAANGPVVRMIRRMRDAYLARHFGYAIGVPPSLLAEVLIGRFPGGRDTVEDEVCHLAAPRGRARLLEIGFGAGDKLERMHALGWDVYGIELDPTAVERARARGLAVQQGSLVEQAFEDGSFDAIYMSHVIEHVHDPLALVQECQRVLRPGGRLVIRTPNLASWGHARFKQAWVHLDPPRHLVLFTPGSLMALVRHGGFEVERCATSSRQAFFTWLYGSVIRRLGRLPTPGEPPPMRLHTVVAPTLALIAESAMLAFRPDAGEEIVLIGAVREA